MLFVFSSKRKRNKSEHAVYCQNANFGTLMPVGDKLLVWFLWSRSNIASTQRSRSKPRQNSEHLWGNLGRTFQLIELITRQYHKTRRNYIEQRYNTHKDKEGNITAGNLYSD